MSQTGEPVISPGRGEDQGKDSKGVAGQLLQDGQGKGCSLAASGVCRAKHILAGEDSGYAPLLDLGWLHNAQRPADSAQCTRNIRHACWLSGLPP